MGLCFTVPIDLVIRGKRIQHTDYYLIEAKYTIDPLRINILATKTIITRRVVQKHDQSNQQKGGLDGNADRG